MIIFQRNQLSEKHKHTIKEIQYTIYLSRPRRLEWQKDQRFRLPDVNKIITEEFVVIDALQENACEQKHFCGFQKQFFFKVCLTRISMSGGKPKISMTKILQKSTVRTWLL